MPIRFCLLHPEYKLDVEWVVARVCWMLQFTILSWVCYKVSCQLPGIGELRIALKALFYFSLLDIGMYFICGKIGYYAIVYYLLSMFVVVKAAKKSRKTRNFN